jgi:hypothetical protein
VRRQKTVVTLLVGAIERASETPINVRREERRLQAMCRSWLAKHPNVEPLPKRERKPMSERPPRRAGGPFVRSDRARSRSPRPDEKPAMPAIVADGVIAALRDKGGDIMLTEGAMWLYDDGVWRAVEAADEIRMRVLIQEGCAFFGKQHDSKVANAAWKLLNEHPGFSRPACPG